MSTQPFSDQLSTLAPSTPVTLQSEAGKYILATVEQQLPDHFRPECSKNETILRPGTFHRLVPLRIDVDAQSIIHVRLGIEYDRRSLFGEYFLAQIHPDGEIKFSGTSTDLWQPFSSLVPSNTHVHTIDEVDAIARNFVVNYYGCSHDTIQTTSIELVNYRGSARTIQLAYYIRMADFCLSRAETQSLPLIPHLLIDALSDHVLLSWDQIRGHDPHINLTEHPTLRRVRQFSPGADQADDFGDLVGFVQLRTTLSTAGYELRTPKDYAETRDAQEQDPEQIAGHFDLGSPFVSADDTWGGPQASNRIKAAVETHYATTTFLDFLQDFFGLRSLDNRQLKLQALTNVGKDYNNAFWYQDVIHIGHGDNQTFGRLSTIDIIGHELAHGITEKSAGLIYRGESGGLNESYSDIIGTLFEWWHTQSADPETSNVHPFDWRLGEDTFTPHGSDDDALRFMDDPLADGRSLDHFDNYQENIDVHYSSGIQNHAFYLSVEGGQHRLGGHTIGLKAHYSGDMERAMRSAGQIWMHALQHYLQPASTFRDARRATLQSANDIFAEDQRTSQIISEAWDAVGVAG
ncbi:MAG: M4 family metallopeptidase [Myxococcales bacterium]|nr:M4 family metallopeptidase [Myxococcales bacterium]